MTKATPSPPRRRHKPICGRAAAFGIASEHAHNAAEKEENDAASEARRDAADDENSRAD